MLHVARAISPIHESLEGNGGRPGRGLWKAHLTVNGFPVFPCGEEAHCRVFGQS